jgi:hypothetical protein
LKEEQNILRREESKDEMALSERIQKPKEEETGLWQRNAECRQSLTDLTLKSNKVAIEVADKENRIPLLETQLRNLPSSNKRETDSDAFIHQYLFYILGAILTSILVHECDRHRITVFSYILFHAGLQSLLPFTTQYKESVPLSWPCCPKTCAVSVK